LNDDADARARIGRVLNDKWTLERLLGIGGMGAVYEGRHRNGARAAVKALHLDLARHPDVRERFLREGYAANKVEHPGVVKVIDDDKITTGPDAGTAYLVMELLAGESLEDRVERGPQVSEREFLRIAEAVLEVLEAAHAAGVVHRDLKPENIFLARDEAAGETRIKVLDFGLARLLDSHTTTMHGVAVGTPSYMSPEQASGRHDEIDGRADLFSLTASGFRLVTGRRIHEGGNAVELVTRMANLPAPLIQKVAKHVSDPFARVIDRALEFRKEDRYPNAAAMREDVKRARLELEEPAPNSRQFQEAPTIIAAPLAPSPPIISISLQPDESVIELSARDLVRADAKQETASNARPTTPEDVQEIEPEPSIEPPKPKGTPWVEHVVRPEPPPAPPPVVPGAPPFVPGAPRITRSIPDEASEVIPAPRKARPSFIPVVTAVFLGGIALKLALETKTTDAAAEATEPAPSAEVDAMTPARVEAPDAAALAAPASIADASADASADATEDVASEAAASEEDAAADAEEDAEEDEEVLEVIVDGSVDDDATPMAPHAPAAHAASAPTRVPVRAPTKPTPKPKPKPHGTTPPHKRGR